MWYAYAMPEEKTWQKSKTFGEACGHAWDGVKLIARDQRNLKILWVTFVLAMILAALLRVTLVEMALIIFISATIMAAEMFNGALEAVLDITWPEYRPAVKAAKDMTAGAVLVLSLAAVAGALLLFVPRLIEIVY